MTDTNKTAPAKPVEAPAPQLIDLGDPWIAALLAWLVPGLGHWYQRRRSKAVLFLVCILGTFLYGLYLGEGRVVYASWRKNDRRLPFVCQAGVGMAMLPALAQSSRMADAELQVRKLVREWEGESRWHDWFMAPPLIKDQLSEIAFRNFPNPDWPVDSERLDAHREQVASLERKAESAERSDNHALAREHYEEILKLVPGYPRAIVRQRFGVVFDGENRAVQVASDELDSVHKRLHHFWELGTVFTMIAGLLNILAVYDAFAGPAYSAPAGEPTKAKPTPAESQKK
jgi:hypothetical protein